MVAPIKELTNTLCFTFIKVLSTNSIAQIPSNIDMDIDFDISRRRSVSSSNKSSRESSMHSAASSIPYYKRMETQSNNPLWSEQVEIEEIALSYAMSAKKDSIPVKQTINNSPKEGI